MSPAEVASPPPAAAEVVVSRKDDQAVVATLDLPLDLAKGKRREAAIYRRAVFVTSSVVWRGAAGKPERYGWTYKAYLQRELCLTSITGLFACSTPETEPLAETAEGEAPVAGDVAPEADAALSSFIARLKARADTIFAEDRRDHLARLLKAAGVTTTPRRALRRR